MSAQHTPGPWRCKRGLTKNDVGIFAEGKATMSDGSESSGLLIAECYEDIRNSRERNAGEAFANALLMTAAPDLYEALKEAREYIVRETGACVDNIDAALAKVQP